MPIRCARCRGLSRQVATGRRLSEVLVEAGRRREGLIGRPSTSIRGIPTAAMES
jgi:hypothetical protein